jgi:hypothetical protein
MSEYEDMQKKLDASIRKDAAKQRVIRKKREEKQQIRKAGGGHAVAKSVFMINDEPILTEGVDFNFGHNKETIDERIAREVRERCMESVNCPGCGYFHGYCSEIKEDKEKQKMLPTGDESQSSGSRKRTGGMDWLKNEDLSKTPKEAKILGVRLDSENRYGPRVNVKLALDGKIKFWGVPTAKSKSPNYRLLLDKFGADENDWIDKRILLLLEQDEFSGQWFARVDFPQEGKSSRK